MVGCVYTAVVGQKSAYVYQIDIKTNQMVTMLGGGVNPAMQSLAYDPVTNAPVLSGIAGEGKQKGPAARFFPGTGSTV